MSKLGFYISDAGDLRRIVQAQPRIVVTDDLAALQILHNALGDRCILIAGTAATGTDWGAFWRDKAQENLARALDLWMQAAQPGLQAAPFAFWMSFQGLRDRTLSADYAAFEQARVERLAQIGVRACVGNTATGLPDPYDPLWREFVSVCQTAQAHNGLLGLQEFGALYLWTGYGSNIWTGSSFRAERKFPEEYREDASLCLHYRQVYREFPASSRLPLVITACGLGATADTLTAALSHDGQPTSGWQTCIPTWRQRDGVHDPADFYVRQLQWYDAQLERDPAVLGAAVYGWGVGGSYEIEGRVADLLLTHVAAGPHPAGAILPESAAAPTSAAVPERRTPMPAPRNPAAGGQWYYVAVDHPELFDTLWQQAEPAAESTQATITWKQTKDRFVILTNDFGVWQQLYLYGQFLAQAQNAEIEGGETNAASVDKTYP